MMTSVKKFTSYSNSIVFIAFLKAFKLLSMCTKFQVNSSSLSRNKYGGDNFTPIPRKRLQDQHTSTVGIGLIKLTEPSDILNYKSFFKHCILKTILHVFLLLIFVWN